MRQTAFVFFILLATTLAFAEENPADKPADAKKPDTLVTVSWVHPADGGQIMFTAYVDGTFLLTKTFKPAKEGDKVPVLAPVTGTMQEMRFRQLKEAVEKLNWAEIKPEYPAPADIDRTGGACVTYAVSATVKGETRTTVLAEARNNKTIPGELKFIAMIGRIMFDVRFGK